MSGNMQRRFSTRAKLREIISKAWEICMEQDYPRNIINGERALQACFYHRLMLILLEVAKYPRRTVFVEPKLSFPGGRYCYPDIVVCDSTRVIAVVELKFLPRGILSPGEGGELKKGVAKDISTLSEVAVNFDTAGSGQTSIEMRIVHERYLGVNAKAHTYTISNDSLLVWAGIYRKPANVSSLDEGFVFKDHPLFQGKNWLEIHSLTHDGLSPETHKFSSRTMKSTPLS